MKLVSKVAASLLLLGLSTIVFAQATSQSQDSDQGVKSDVKQAGRSTESAAKKTAHKVKKGTKKVTHKAAKKTREGAEKVEDKTQAPPQ